MIGVFDALQPSLHQQSDHVVVPTPRTAARGGALHPGHRRVELWVSPAGLPCVCCQLLSTPAPSSGPLPTAGSVQGVRRRQECFTELCWEGQECVTSLKALGESPRVRFALVLE